MTNSNHVLYSYLPDRSHNRSLITKTIPTSINMTFWYGFLPIQKFIDRLMCVAALALSYFTFMFYYFYRFLLSSCVFLTPNKVYDDAGDESMLYQSLDKLFQHFGFSFLKHVVNRSFFSKFSVTHFDTQPTEWPNKGDNTQRFVYSKISTYWTASQILAWHRYPVDYGVFQALK